MSVGRWPGIGIARGALSPGVLLNGTFNSDLANWTLAGSAGGTIEWNSGKMRVERTSTTTSGYQPILLTGGVAYRFTCAATYISGSVNKASLTLRNGTLVSSAVLGTVETAVGGSGTLTLDYTPGSTMTAYIHPTVGGGSGVYDFDDVTLGLQTTQPSIVGTPVPAGITSNTSLSIPDVVVTSAANSALIVLLSNNLLSDASGVTRDGQSFTFIGRKEGSTYTGIHAYILLNPNVGTANVTVSMSSGATLYAVAFQVRDVNQTTPTADGDGPSGTSNTTSITVANRTAADLVIGGVSVDNNGASVAVTTGTAIAVGNQSWADSGFAYSAGGDTVAFSHNNAERSGYAFRLLPA